MKKNKFYFETQKESLKPRNIISIKNPKKWNEEIPNVYCFLAFKKNLSENIKAYTTFLNQYSYLCQLFYSCCNCRIQKTNFFLLV